MKSFEVYRGHDESGISGTGKVMEGVIFSDGRVALQWMSTPRSFVMWDRFEDMWTINIASHPSNATVVHFSDNRELRQSDSPDIHTIRQVLL